MGPVSVDIEEDIKWIYSGIPARVPIAGVAWNLCSQRRFAPCVFKVGISGRPEYRWAQHYFYEGYYRMYVIYRSEDPEPVEELEETLIRDLRS